VEIEKKNLQNVSQDATLLI